MYSDDVEMLADTVPAHGGSYGRRAYTFVDYSQLDGALTHSEGVGTMVTLDVLSN
ncbi:hypothetical protein [Natrinema sp. HArc-T2]|uniref:hypothetical protein n=1 Tax=Natrinema sp. HArc-T2 TaxID=3242701 RepID=UPI00359CC770